MKRSLPKHTLCIFTIVSLAFAFAVPGLAQTTDTDTAEVSLIVTGPSETPSVTETPTETATATATETATSTEEAIDPGKVAGVVSQLPNTGTRDIDTSASLGVALLAMTGAILIGSAGVLIKQRS